MATWGGEYWLLENELNSIQSARIPAIWPLQQSTNCEMGEIVHSYNTYTGLARCEESHLLLYILVPQ